MKYETIDAKQIDDLMDRIEPRPPADWIEADNSNDDDKPSAPTAKVSSGEPKADSSVNASDPSTDTPAS